MAIREEEDYKIMERLRRRIADIVDDPHTAEALKPYYRFLCKRPCSQRRVPADLQPPQRHAGRRVGVQGRGTADREGHRRQRR